jgi:hypothetical protein
MKGSATTPLPLAQFEGFKVDWARLRELYNKEMDQVTRVLNLIIIRKVGFAQK